MNNELYNELNTLLSYLKSSKVVTLVEEFYAKYENSAPALLLEEAIEKVEKRLKNHFKKYKNDVSKLDSIIEETKANHAAELEELKELRLSALCKIIYKCPKCNAKKELCNYIVLQNYHYEEPWGCTGGDRWDRGRSELICPNCSIRIRPLKNPKILHLPDNPYDNSHFEVYHNIVDWYESTGSRSAYLKKYAGECSYGDHYQERSTDNFEKLGEKLGIDFKKAVSSGNFVNI